MLFFIIAFFLFFYVYIKRMIRDSFSKKVILSFWTIWFISLVISTFNPYGLYPVSDEVYVIMLLNVSAIILGFSSVKVNKNITDIFLKSMSKGIYLKELEVTTKPCKINRINSDTFRIILTQGLNRQIRRMCQELGYKVVELTRIRIMNIELGGLKCGEYRLVEGTEKKKLYESL